MFTEEGMLQCSEEMLQTLRDIYGSTVMKIIPKAFKGSRSLRKTLKSFVKRELYQQFVDCGLEIYPTVLSQRRHTFTVFPWPLGNVSIKHSFFNFEFHPVRAKEAIRVLSFELFFSVYTTQRKPHKVDYNLRSPLLTCYWKCALYGAYELLELVVTIRQKESPYFGRPFVNLSSKKDTSIIWTEEHAGEDIRKMEDTDMVWTTDLGTFVQTVLNCLDGRRCISFNGDRELYDNSRPGLFAGDN